MNALIFGIIGFGLGAAVLYFIQMKDLDRLDESERELAKARRALTDAEIAHETRLKEAIAELQTEYQRKHELEIQSLSLDFNEKIQALKTQVRELELRELERQNIQTISAVESVPEQTQAGTAPITMEPPILVADIRPLQQISQPPIPSPTGKTIDPPILARTPKQAQKASSFKASSFKVVSWQPPILAATIQALSNVPQLLLSTPTGKQCEPPILAQFSEDKGAIAPKKSIESFEPPILAAEIRYAPEQPITPLSQPSNKTIYPPIQGR
ncbi:hypothetical protein [[Limnothrix rosea] IAM M-220]|uniref:hypothetical protein n=1 Tax=[Limnothrix rosea] IAM M-220 TaxID=454133 RepID=UPI000965CC37|nr:hypothetical protein [[Limnothrix rosea] IAM M-220]OKH17275.1 hypothetical protein NIES208_09995 [[Limnothrix rosea] IAM M-220]